MAGHIGRHVSASVYVLLIVLIFRTECSSVYEELEVGLEFSEFDLEDYCIHRTEAEWSYMVGEDEDLSKVREAEMNTADFLRKEADQLITYVGQEFNNPKLERLFQSFYHPGAALLPQDSFKQYVNYATSLQEIRRNEFKINCLETGESVCEELNRNQVDGRLLKEKSEKVLKKLWTEWHRQLENTTGGDEEFIKQMELLRTEAQLNGEEDLPKYWLRKTESTWLDYETVLVLWRKIMPLYQKLRRYLATSMAKKYGREIIINNTLIATHVLGSIDSKNWLKTAEKYDVLLYSQTYNEIQESMKKLNNENIYRIADNTTSQMNLGDMHRAFYKRSVFDDVSKTCQLFTVQHCKLGHDVKINTCSKNKSQWLDLVTAYESIMRAKTQMLAADEDQENGFMLREGTSVLYEAAVSLSATLGTKPENLRKHQIIPESTALKDQQITYLLLNALNLLPKLPYYLLSDLWRINTIRHLIRMSQQVALTTEPPMSSSSTTESDWYADFNKWTTKKMSSTSESASYSLEVETSSSFSLIRNDTSLEVESEEVKEVVKLNVIQYPFDYKNLSQTWWEFREKFEGIATPDGDVYPTYLLDDDILWNRPYLSKFIGSLLQFQLLEVLGPENNSIKLKSVLQQGKSKPWEQLIADSFNITSIKVEPLLNYFKPLEDFLDAGGSFDSLDGNVNLLKAANWNDFPLRFTTQKPIEKETEPETDTSITTVAICIIIAAVAVIALIIILKRIRTKKRLQRKKKLQLAELNGYA